MTARLTLLSSFLILLAVLAAAPARAIESPAEYISLMDYDTGEIIYEKNGTELMAPASMSKLMTMVMLFDAIRDGRVTLEDEFVISENAWRKGGAASGSSTMFAELGSRVPVKDLIYGVIVQSGNDACIAIAEALEGSEAAFAEKMTERAREIGLAKSTFRNATGWPDEGHLMTANELAKLARYIIDTYPEFYEIYAVRDFEWNGISQSNRNPLLYMNMGADGLKTGFTNEAGYNLVGSATRNGLRLIVVVTGLKNAKDRADDAKKLLDYGFREFEARILFAENQIISEAKVYGGAQGKVPVTAGEQIRLMVPRNVSERISAKMVYTGPVRAPIREGQEIGKLQVMRGDAKVLEVPVQASEAVEVGTVTQRAFDAAAELVVNVFRSAAKRL